MCNICSVQNLLITVHVTSYCIVHCVTIEEIMFPKFKALFNFCYCNWYIILKIIKENISMTTIYSIRLAAHKMSLKNLKVSSWMFWVKAFFFVVTCVTKADSMCTYFKG